MTRPKNVGPRTAQEWRKHTPCKKITDENLEAYPGWVNEKSHWAPYAKGICKNYCQLAEICLKDALDDPDSQGLRAGVYFNQGKITQEDINYLVRTYPNVSASKIRRRYKDRHAQDEDL